ncbi:MAG: FixH family protein [Acidobacteriota bacterium]|nr:FixH family protein [Acidobacteriota bacterium]
MLVLIVFLASLGFTGCGTGQKAVTEAEDEAIARTEFTDRIENFFEYEPLKAGKPSQFLIHLTDLTDGTPVEKADVTLVARSRGGAEVAQTKARVGKVTGIYVADVNLPNTGEYDIEFRVKNEKIDERLPLSDFKVE